MNPYLQYMYSYPHKTSYRPLEGVRLEEYLPALAGSGHGLYLHIPFCQTKCGYCNLFSVTGQDRAAIDRYLDTVERQSRQYGNLLVPLETEFSSLTIGGGTPLLLSEQQLAHMFSILESCFRFSPGRELVIETAPNQTSRNKLRLLKESGVTRVSMGIQSFSDQELGTLRRSHRAGRAREALSLLKSFDFPCINVDLIYGIPGQTIQSLLDSLREALTFEPDELFLYPLYIRHGAKLEREPEEGMVFEPELAFAQYQEASAFLRSRGFRQDSMRRFLRKGGQRMYSECGFGTSLALGCGGRSYLGRLHFCTPYAITRSGCLARLAEYEQTRDFASISHGMILSQEELKRRYVIRHLLIQPGLSLTRYTARFGSQAEKDFPLLVQWLEAGYVERQSQADAFFAGTPSEKAGAGREETFLTLTPAGTALSDYLGPQLVSPQVRRYIEEWEASHG